MLAWHDESTRHVHDEVGGKGDFDSICNICFDLYMIVLNFRTSKLGKCSNDHPLHSVCV